MADLVQMIFIGFTFFQANRTQQGLRSQLFGIFALLTTFMSFVEQTIPFFVVSRSLYEVRERPSKTYSWKAFMFANIAVEIPWNLVRTQMAVEIATDYPQNSSLARSCSSAGGSSLAFTITPLLPGQLILVRHWHSCLSACTC